MLNVNLNGIDTLMLDFDGANTAVLTAPGVTTVTHTGVATGITQLTGDVTAGPGSGPQIATLSNTSTARSHLGLGTMATQNANAVAVTGGTIDGATVGAMTPSTVTASAATVEGQLVVNTSTGATSLFKCPSSTVGALSCQRFASGDTDQVLGVVNETNTAWVTSINADGAIEFPDSTKQRTAATNPTFQTNGTNNTVQNKLNFVAGANVTLTAGGSGDVTVASSSGASSNHFTNTGSTPTAAVGTAAGAGTIGITGGDAAGSIVITAGTGATAGTVCTVTFATPYTGTATVLISPAGFTAQQLSGNCAFIVTSGGNAVGFEIHCQGSMVNATGYQWNYIVMGMP